MEKRRLSLNRTGGAKNYNSPMKGGPYSAHPVHYKMIEDIHLDLDAMDNEIDKALNSTSTKVRQVAHSFTVLQSIYFNTDTGKWVLAQADDKDTIGTHVVVEVIDKDYFVAGLSGIFEVKNTLDLGYWFTSDTVAGELVDTAPDINNPMIQVIDSNSIRVLDIGVVDNLDSIPASNVIVTNTVTPDFTPAVQGNNLQQVTNKVAGLQENVVADIELIEAVSTISIDVDIVGDFGILIYCPLFVDETANPTIARINIRLNNNSNAVYGWSTAYTNYMTANGTARNSQFSSQIFYSIGNEFIVQQGNYYESGREIYPGNTKGLNAADGVNNIQFLTLTPAMMAIGTKIKVIRL